MKKIVIIILALTLCNTGFAQNWNLYKSNDIEVWRTTDDDLKLKKTAPHGLVRFGANSTDTYYDCDVALCLDYNHLSKIVDVRVEINNKEVYSERYTNTELYRYFNRSSSDYAYGYVLQQANQYVVKGVQTHNGFRIIID